LAGLRSQRLCALHGGGGEGLDVALTGNHPLSVFRTVADREGFIVVYPGGLPAADVEGNVGWVDCRADNLVTSNADDIGFLNALVQRIGTEYALDRSRLFMTGGSNGAQMTHAFAFHHADRVGAVATGSGSLPLTPKTGPCTTGPSRPLPILILHGDADFPMPWAGGCVANLGGACNRGRVLSAEATRDRWLQINGLQGVVPTQSTVEVDNADGGPAQRFDYAGANPLQWWRLNGAGHTTPSRTVLVSPNPASGIQNRDIEFAEVAWAFFASRLPTGGTVGGTADEPSVTGVTLPTPDPPNASCPAGFFIATVDDGPNAGLTPGAFGMELLLEDPGTRVLAGGLNFGSLVDTGQVGFAGFSFANAANENQRLALSLRGSPADNAAGTLQVRVKIVRQDSATASVTVFDGSSNLTMTADSVASITAPPGFYVATVAVEGVSVGPVGGSPEGQFFFSLTTSFVDRPGGGFQGGAVVGGYHATHPFGGVSGFAGFCLFTQHTASMRVLSAPTYGDTGARDLRLRVLDANQDAVITHPTRGGGSVP